MLNEVPDSRLRRGGCLRVPAAASAGGSGTDVTFRDRLCKENVNIYLRILIQRKAKLQSLGSSWRLRKEENEVGGCIVALWPVPPQLHQHGLGGLHACLCGCCQAWHCCKSALTEREKVLMGFLSKGKCFLQKRFCMVTASPAGAVQDEYFCLLNAFKTGKCGLIKM